MGLAGSPWILAQAAGVWSPAASAYLALRRWCGGLTLTPSRPAPDWDVVWLVAAAPAVLIALTVAAQGPTASFKQFFDLFGHARFAREAAARLRRAGRAVTVMLACTVLSWTAGQCLGFFFEDAERGRMDMNFLKRSRGPVELVLEHGATASTTPLRDVAGLADNFPLLAAAAVVVLSARSLRLADAAARKRLGFDEPDPAADRTGTWRPMVGTCLVAYILYRLFSRVAGGGEVPVGNCLILEVAIIPALMLICDGFLLAWILAEFRDGETGDDQANRIDPSRAYRLMPAACLGCFAALPARYTATALLLASQHVPAAAMSTDFGRFIRWSLGPGLVVQQAASLVAIGVIGAIAWSGGGLGEAALGFRRLLAGEGARLAVLTIFSGFACAVVSAAAYAVLLLLPSAGWVLPAADAYAHYATLPVGLLTLAALVQLAERSLPVASRADVETDPGASAADGGEVENLAEASTAPHPA